MAHSEEDTLIIQPIIQKCTHEDQWKFAATLSQIESFPLDKSLLPVITFLILFTSKFTRSLIKHAG